MSAILCPSCRSPLRPGTLTCETCGTALLREVVPGGAEPTCAVHPTRLGLAICERCGAFACATCVRQDSHGQTLCTACHEREPDTALPWDEREELGLLQAFWRTFVLVLLHPDRFASARAEGSVGSSLLFALLASLPSAVSVGLLYTFIFSFLPQLFAHSNKDTSTTDMRWLGPAIFVFCLIVIPLASLLSTVVGAGLDHLVLRMGGITRRYGVTLRAHALSQAPWALGAVPIVGAQVGLVWAMVARVFAYRGLHRTSWGTAVAGTLLGPALSCFLCGGAYAALIATALANIPVH